MLRTLRLGFGFSAKAFNPAKNYYKILEVEETAPQDRIKASFKTLAKRYHPDVNKGKEEQFKEVNEAYQVLSDQPTKREYDSARQVATNPQTNSHPYSQQNPYTHQHPYYQQGGFNPRQQEFNESHRSYNEHPFWKNPNQYYNQGQYGGWAARDQWLYEQYRQQQEEFMKKYQQAQRQRFERGRNRGGRSPIEDEYMRRFAEEMMAREQLRRAKEEMRNERERQAREEQERLERQYAQNKRKLRAMGKVLIQDVKDIGKAAWDLWLNFKSKK